MVGIWKRLLLSMVSVLVVIAVFSLILLMVDLSSGAKDSWSSFYYFYVATLYCSLPGLFLALPLVLGVTNIRAWRFWVILVIGASIGPLVMTAPTLYRVFVTESFTSLSRVDGEIALLALGVSGPATLIYLLLMGWAQRRNPMARASDEISNPALNNGAN